MYFPLKTYIYLIKLNVHIYIYIYVYSYCCNNWLTFFEGTHPGTLRVTYLKKVRFFLWNSKSIFFQIFFLIQRATPSTSAGGLMKHISLECFKCRELAETRLFIEVPYSRCAPIKENRI